MKVFIILFALFTLCHGNGVVNFDLSAYNPVNKTTHLYMQFVNLTERLTVIEVTNAPSDVRFFIVQVHSFVYNLTLSSTPEKGTETYIKGTNVGLVALNTPDATFYIQDYNSTVTVLISVIPYEDKDPIPGGCNLTFDTELAPYQLISNTGDLIIVHSQAPYVDGITCEKDQIGVEMYHMFLSENNHKPDCYFDGIKDMMTVDLIRKNGRKISTVSGYFKYRKLYSSYMGIGQVFAIIATYGNHSSAYIPAVSYGCDLNNPESCIGPETPHWKLICATLLIFGLSTCFFGHKFFRITLYLIGYTIGVIVTYVTLSFNHTLSVEEKTTIAIIIGFVYGAVWLLIWWKFGIPILSVTFIFFLSALLISSIIFYAGVADFTIFRSDINYWLITSSIIIAFLIISTMFTLHSHIFACSFLGAYACITALNYYTGGNLQYIIINTYRRIVVPNFNMATIDPPFQMLDIWQTVFWVVLTSFGCYHQWRDQRGRPPFPPPRSTVIETRFDETTPLLRE